MNPAFSVIKGVISAIVICFVGAMLGPIILLLPFDLNRSILHFGMDNLEYSAATIFAVTLLDSLTLLLLILVSCIVPAYALQFGMRTKIAWWTTSTVSAVAVMLVITFTGTWVVYVPLKIPTWIGVMGIGMAVTLFTYFEATLFKNVRRT